MRSLGPRRKEHWGQHFRSGEEPGRGQEVGRASAVEEEPKCRFMETKVAGRPGLFLY